MPDILPRSRGVVWILGFELIVLHWEKPMPIRQIIQSQQVLQQAC